MRGETPCSIASAVPRPEEKATGVANLGPARRAVAAFGLPLEGGRLLLRERRLWSLALVSMLLSLGAFVAAIAFVVSYAAEIHSGVTGWIPTIEAAHWITWLWVGPARLAFAVMGALLFLVVAGACLVAATVVAGLLASPFHDLLSLRVERIVTGTGVDDTGSGPLEVLREGGRALGEELRRVAFYLSVVGALAGLGFLIPGAHVVTGPLILGFTILFLPLDYASHALDRRRLSFAGKRRWVGSDLPAMLGFGSAAFLTYLVPGLNFVAMPVLVVGGTLLVLRHPPD